LVAQTRVPDAGGAPAPGAAEAAALQCYGGGISGTGDVEGPSSSTDNAIARYDGTTGTQLSNSSATLDDAGRIAATALSLTDDLAVVHGGTGASTAVDARTNLGLGSLAVKNSVATGDIDANAVTDAKLRTSSPGSVIGRASLLSSGDPADISAGSDHQVLRRSGTTIGFGALNLAQSAAVTGALPIANGGTGATQARDALSNLGTLKSTVIAYTGSGVSGKTVTLTGINRAHAIFMQRYDTTSSVVFNISLPMGATGTIYRRATNGYGGSEFSLNAPAAGTAQTLTINNTGSDNNASGVTYRLLVIGTST
jgi:hypothetical protein